MGQPSVSYDYDAEALSQIAHRAVGESRVSGLDAVGITACTIANRQHRGYGDGVLDQVLEAYYAPDVTPTDAEFLAVQYWMGRCPEGIVYALGQGDPERMGFDPDSFVIRIGHSRFYRTWGGETFQGDE